jgi:hypothetical protein
MTGAQSIESALPSNQNIAALWRWCYDFVNPLLRELQTGELLGNGIRVAAAGSLNDHPIWNWLIKYMLRAAAEIGSEGAEKISWEKAVARGIGQLAFALACPGDLKNRSQLVSLLAPTLVGFSDGVCWNPARDAASSAGATTSELETLDTVAKMAEELKERWRRFLVAQRGY